MTDATANGTATAEEAQAATAEDRDLIAAFTGSDSAYFQERFVQLQQNRLPPQEINLTALGKGFFWAAERGNWLLFWIALGFDVLGLLLLAAGTWPPDDRSDPTTNLLWGAILLLGGRLLTAWLADRLYYRQFQRWRVDRRVNSGRDPQRLMLAAGLALITAPILIYRATQAAPTLRECKRLWRSMAKGEEAALMDRFNCWTISDVPVGKTYQQHLAEAIDNGVTWLTVTFEAFFDAITVGVRWVLNVLEIVFVGMPWPLMAFILILIAWRAAGRNVAIFTACSLFYLGIFGFWQTAMSTLSLVGAATLLCVVMGVPIGVWCAKSPRAYSVIRPILDIMQTLPSFVYLIPAIAFFGVGKPPGILATVVFALPPMVRLTALGVTQVPESVKEAALAFGAKPRQLLWKVELPLAIPSIMTGINQSIMMSLSLVVIAALIAAGGLGEDVIFALQHVEHGKGLLAGAAIALCAMIMDRIVQGSRKRAQD